MAVHPSGRGAFHGDGSSGLRPERLVDVTDGLSNTVFVGERHTITHGTRGPFWANSFNLYSRAGAAWPANSGIPTSIYMLPDYDTCRAKINANYCKYGWGSLHSGGNKPPVQRRPRSQHFRDDRQPDLRDLATIAGQEVIPDF